MSAWRRFASCLSAIVCLMSQTGPAQTTGDFRSLQNGNWTDVTSWEEWDGGAWVTPAPHAPPSSDGVITIQSTHSITVDAANSVLADQIVVDSCATVTVGPGRKLIVADGADSIDMVVSGTLTSSDNGSRHCSKGSHRPGHLTR